MLHFGTNGFLVVTAGVWIFGNVLLFATNARVFGRPGLGSTMTNYPAVMKKIAANPELKGVAPFVYGPVLVETQPEVGQAIQWAPNVRGMDPAVETNVSSIASSITDGQFDVSGRGVLIGTKFAEKMELRVGSRMDIYSLRQLKKVRESLKKEQGKVTVLPDEYEVRGIFDSGYYEFNANVIIVSLENAQDMYGIGDTVEGLSVMLNDPFRAATVRDQLDETLGFGYRVTMWLEESPLLAAVMVEKNMMLYILFFIVIVAAFGITCTLITFIVMKTREIGMLKAVGASNRQVMQVFLGQSVIVSVMGILLGVGSGLLLLHYRNEFLELMRRMTGMELFPVSIYNLPQLPAKIIPGDIAIICGGSLLICVLAAGFPAWFASRMNPVEALRYE